MHRKIFCTLITMQFFWLSCMCNENAMTKISYHHGFITDKISCYFKSSPVCNSLPNYRENYKNKGWKAKRFLLPMTNIENFAEVKKTLTEVNEMQNNHYKINFKLVSKPVKGVEIFVYYHPNKIAFQTETGTFINDRKSLNFHFHHKDHLNDLKQKTDELLLFACFDNIKPKIVIDCGHGAHDSGAIGVCGIVEKDITLCIGKKLVSQLKNNGFEVCMTREDDSFYSLGERTRFANTKQADLFLSLHANASSNAAASGIETYWSAHKNFKEIYSTLQQEDKQILSQFYSSRSMLSKRCAQHVQLSLIAHCKAVSPVVDRGDREAESQILFGTEMPAILVEIAFLTNQKEAQLVLDERYQNALVTGIFTGICHHFNIIS